MASDVQNRARLLEASLDPRTNKSAEAELNAEEAKSGFALSLLHIVADQSFPNHTRLAGALCFKNFLKRQWTDADSNHKLPTTEVETIKREIIGLMIGVPPNVQAQLGDAVGIIADSDFWRNWDTLVRDLAARFNPSDYSVNNGVLTVAHSIFKRWRPLFRSDELFTEINHVLQNFGTPFLSLVAQTDAMIDQGASNKKAGIQLLSAMTLTMKLIYDLSCQDLPPVFEDHVSQIAGLFQKYLSLDQPSLHTDSDDESGPLEYLKSSVFEVLALYVQKYEDAITGHVGEFVQRTWILLTTMGPEPKFDILTSKSLHFLTTVIRLPEHGKAFGEETSMRQVVEQVVLPNLALRESDIELFEDDPIEFIRRDLEGSDVDTRRRAATDLLRALVAQHEKTTTKIVNTYISHFLTEYTRSPTENWKAKDTAIYLFCSVAAKGSVTSREGVKNVSEGLNIVDFFQANVANDLVKGDGVQPILKVDAVKYLYIFRSQLDKSQWAVAFPLLIQHLASPQYVVYTYAAIAVERALALTDDSGNPVISRESVVPQAKDLLAHLFNLIEKDFGTDQVQSANKTQENEFLMRCVMRVLTVMRGGLIPLLPMLTANLVEITTVVCANPSNPRFCYYLFEALGALINFAGPVKTDELVSTLFPPFSKILEADIQDFTPYVFQLLAALLESAPKNTMPQSYQQLIPLVLKVDLWLSKGNVPALVRFLSSMIERAAPDFVESGQIEPVLGIFDRLLSLRASEVYATELLECILAHFPKQSMANYYVPLMSLVLNKLEKGGESFHSRFVKLYHFISASVNEGLGADFLIEIINKIGENYYVPIYLKIVLPGTPKLARPLDRKIAIISLTRTLTKSEAFAVKYAKGWGFTCDRLLELLINPPVISQSDDIMAEHDVDDAAFGVGYTQLVTVKKPSLDPWPNVTNVKTFVSEELKTAEAQDHGKISRFVEERLADESRKALLAYMQG